MFLGPNKKYIALMLADNCLKIIPLVRNIHTKVQLSAAFNVRIMHPEISQVIPIHNSKTQDQHIGLFLMQKKYGPRGEVQGQPKYQLLKYKLDIAEQELVEIQGSKDAKIEFVSDQINHIEPLPFGGFLAFDLEFVYLYGEGSSTCVDARKLRRSLVVSALTKVDEYDPTTGATTEGKDFLRYLMGTEAGEVYMVAFHLEVLRELTKGGTRSLS